MKKLIAYSSVAHMGFVTMGIFTMTAQGVQGGIFQMLSHGIVSGALFLCVGVDLRPHAHARDRRLWRPRQPHAALRAASSWSSPWPMSACPGTSGFVGEFLTLVGAFRSIPGSRSSPRPASSCRPPTRSGSTAASSSGRWRSRSLAAILDLSRREKVILVPLIVLTILFGVYPALDHRRHGGLGRPADRQLPGGACRQPATAVAAVGDAHEHASHVRRFGRPARADPRRRRDGAPDGRRLRRRTRRARSSSGVAIVILLVAAAAVIGRRRGRVRSSDGAFVVDAFARFMKVAALLGSAVAIVLAGRFARREGFERFEYPDPHPARHARHDGDDLGERPHRALSRASSCSRSPPTSSPRSTATRRARPRRASSISSSARSRPACSSTAPRWSTASPATPSFPEIAARAVEPGGRSGSSSASSSCSPASPSRSRPCRSTCGRRTSTRARRRR